MVNMTYIDDIRLAIKNWRDWIHIVILNILVMIFVVPIFFVMIGIFGINFILEILVIGLFTEIVIIESYAYIEKNRDGWLAKESL